MNEDHSIKKRPIGLGRGLSSLLGEVAEEASVTGGDKGLQMLSIASMVPHPRQPRRHFDEESLAELAASIKARGLIQPIVVRPMDGGFQIVAGERRWRAAQKAQLHEVPVVIRDLDDTQTLEIAIVENIQRQDLNAIEEAEAYKRLIEEFGHTQEVLGKIVHKSRSHVANLLRLLDLPEDVRVLIVSGSLSMGHARALVSAENPAALAAEVVKNDLSVRETEKLVRAAKAVESTAHPAKHKNNNADIELLERQLGDLLGLKISIKYNHTGGGSLTLHYSSLDQLDMICQRLSGEKI